MMHGAGLFWKQCFPFCEKFVGITVKIFTINIEKKGLKRELNALLLQNWEIKFILASFRKVKTLPTIYNCCHTYVQGIKVLREIEEYAKTFKICWRLMNILLTSRICSTILLGARIRSVAWVCPMDNVPAFKNVVSTCVGVLVPIDMIFALSHICGRAS